MLRASMLYIIFGGVSNLSLTFIILLAIGVCLPVIFQIRHGGCNDYKEYTVPYLNPRRGDIFAGRDFFSFEFRGVCPVHPPYCRQLFISFGCFK